MLLCMALDQENALCVRILRIVRISRKNLLVYFVFCRILDFFPKVDSSMKVWQHVLSAIRFYFSFFCGTWRCITEKA